jgi:adenine deaminase
MVDLILKNGYILDAFSKQVIKGDVLIRDSIITGIESNSQSQAKKVLDISGMYVSPGFIDFHLHIESSMLSPLEFSREAVKHGTTSIFVDPHEIANVCGRKGIKLFLDQAEHAPLDMFLGIPSCVPATNLESSGATITIDDIRELMGNKRVFGLAEMMNFPGIIYGYGDAREKVDIIFKTGKIVDGHCPGVTGEDLKKYITNGENDGVVRILSDHETSNYDEAIEKINLGMYVGLRLGSATKDLINILPGLITNRVNLEKFMICSDDVDPVELFEQGHVDRIIKRARNIIMENSDQNLEEATITAISLATINPGRYFSKFFDVIQSPGIGEVNEGKRANLVIFDSFKDLNIEHVIHSGRIVVENKVLVEKPIDTDYKEFCGRVNVGKKLSPEDFIINVKEDKSFVEVKVIEVIKNSLLTKNSSMNMPVKGGELRADPDKDLSKIAVFERHHASGNRALGFVQGLGIKKGAVASTVAHDSHNLIVAGVDDAAMAKAGNYLVEKGGGMVVVSDRVDFFPLKVAGLMSDDKIENVVRQYNHILTVLKNFGYTLDNTFMTLAFLALPVIPQLKITDKGLVDVDQFKFVKLYD